MNREQAKHFLESIDDTVWKKLNDLGLLKVRFENKDVIEHFANGGAVYGVHEDGGVSSHMGYISFFLPRSEYMIEKEYVISASYGDSVHLNQVMLNDGDEIKVKRNNDGLLQAVYKFKK